MKSYSIGREESCNIIISDPSRVVSRNHATLNVDGMKMTIMDHSSNGTFINGIKISSNTPVPVTRKDVISFANVADLDWNRIPNPAKKIAAICIAGVIGLAMIIAATYYVVQIKEQKEDDAVLFEETKIKEQEKMTDDIKAFKATLDTLRADYELISDRLTKINELCDTKVNNQDLKQVTKTIGNVESSIKAIDLQELKNSITRVEENLNDEVPETPDRIKKVSETIEGYKKSLSEASVTLDNVEENLKKIPNKSAQPSKKNGEKKPEKEKEDTIMTPTILM